MTSVGNPDAPRLNADQMSRLASLDLPAALAEIDVAGIAPAIAIAQLAEEALQRADDAPAIAAAWLQIASELNRGPAPNSGWQASIDYATARLFVQAGDLQAAEASLRQAQAGWQAVSDQAGLVRSDLGLTQILAMQGRYAEAERAIRGAIATLESLAEAPVAIVQQRAMARHNLATLLLYQEQHARALEEFDRVQQWLVTGRELARGDLSVLQDLQIEEAHANLNRASALMALDRPDEAEAALLAAIEPFDRLGRTVDRGRASTNLGALYLRTGRYAQALETFDRAAQDLLGGLSAGLPDETNLESIRRADVLLLDRANAYLALNLLPEAVSELTQSEALFRRSDQPYELGQVLYTLGALHLRTGDLDAASDALLEALATFASLENRYWLNRTRSAQAALRYRQGSVSEARRELDELLAAAVDERTAPIGAIGWDLNSLTEARLLRLQIYLDDKSPDAARRIAVQIGAAIGLDQAGQRSPLPHLQLRLEHALAKIESSAGNQPSARMHLRSALELIESQRTSLPLEEVRSAYLDDKNSVYADLVLNLLEEPEPEPALLVEVFDLIERARSRALLERMIASMDPAVTTGAQQADAAADEMRRQLNWLYNRLLGEQGSRSLDAELSQELVRHESALQQISWRDSALLAQAEPVDLAGFRAAIAGDQQALVYYVAQNELLALLIDRDRVRLFRNLCTAHELSRNLDELRYQLGRAELGNGYLERHAQRLRAGAKRALGQLHAALIAPLAHELTAARLLIITYGDLHLLPFPALWDGEHYLLEQVECSFAPSASIAAHCRQQAQEGHQMRSFAGLALSDPAIPAARHEVETAATHFDSAWLYLDDRADWAGLHMAAQQAEVLHLATHGLFRPDNPFFSSLKLADGWINVREIYRLPLAARLVVLSACESASGRVRGGDEVIGLARGFLGAGVATLVASLWNVHDASAARLMADFYRYLTASPAPRAAQALRAAQLDAVRRGGHPYFWAPFIAIG